MNAWYFGRNASDVDQTAGILRLHDAKGFSAAEKGAMQIDVDDPFPVFERELVDWSPHGDSRVVDEQVEASPAGPNFRKKMGDRCFRSDIGGDRECITARLLDRSRNLRNFRFRSGRKNDVGPVRRVGHCDGFSNAATGAGDDGHFVSQFSQGVYLI